MVDYIFLVKIGNIGFLKLKFPLNYKAYKIPCRSIEFKIQYLYYIK